MVIQRYDDIPNQGKYKILKFLLKKLGLVCGRGLIHLLRHKKLLRFHQPNITDPDLMHTILGPLIPTNLKLPK